MEIRHATENDLPEIMELGRKFGHRMLYIQHPELMLRYINAGRVLVTSVTTPPYKSESMHTEVEVTGFYHYIVSGDPGFPEMLRCYRQMPESIIEEAVWIPTKLCVVMQGGCHRDAFKAMIQYLQARYNVLWCYNSVTDTTKPSSKIEGYRELGFAYDEFNERFTFFNIHKGDFSTYQLGRWSK